MRFNFEGLFGTTKSEEPKKPDPFEPRLQTPRKTVHTVGEPTYVVEPGTRSAANQVERLVQERDAMEKRVPFGPNDVRRVKEIDNEIARLNAVRHNQEVE